MYTSKADLNIELLEGISNNGDVKVLSGVGKDSGKTVLDTLQLTKIKSGETNKQGIRVIKFIPN